MMLLIFKTRLCRILRNERRLQKKDKMLKIKINVQVNKDKILKIKKKDKG